MRRKLFTCHCCNVAIYYLPRVQQVKLWPSLSDCNSNPRNSSLVDRNIDDRPTVSIVIQNTTGDCTVSLASPSPSVALLFPISTSIRARFNHAISPHPCDERIVPGSQIDVPVKGSPLRDPRKHFVVISIESD